MLLTSQRSTSVNAPSSFASSQAKRPVSPVLADARNVLQAMDFVKGVMPGLPQRNRLEMANALLSRMMELAAMIPGTSIAIDHSGADIHLSHGYSPRKKMQDYKKLDLERRLNEAEIGDIVEVECNAHNYVKVRNGCLNYIRKTLGPKDSGNWETFYASGFRAVCIKVLGKPAQTPSQKLSDFLARVS